MRFSTLGEWLDWQEGLHPSKIDLGLERVRRVLQAMGLDRPGYGVITVAGTNGKGSSVAMLEQILLSAGYRAGAYTSPHMLRYNERIRVNGEEVDDERLCAAFQRVDQARASTSLTYFEFGTLAALQIFAEAGLDIVVLEVGMGGRLDAVNVLDADVALVTTIGIDHTQWLGPDRESIGVEKAGILRAGRAAVCADADPPRSLMEHAHKLGAPLHLIGRDYGVEASLQGWTWWCNTRRRHSLPYPRLRGAHQLRNAAAVLMVLELLAERFPVSAADIREGLISATLPGRFQVLDSHGLRICDVAHNPHAALVLAETLAALPCTGRTHAVMAMLADKDIGGVIRAMKPVVDQWYIAGLQVERGASAELLAAHLADNGVSAVHASPDIASAWTHAEKAARQDDRIVVFGSFYTVAAALVMA